MSYAARRNADAARQAAAERNAVADKAQPLADVPTDPNVPGLPGVQGAPPLPGDWGPGTRWGPQGTPGPDPQWLTKFPWYQEPGHPGAPYHPLDPYWQHRKHVKPSASHTVAENPGAANLPTHTEMGHGFGRMLGHIMTNGLVYNQLRDQGLVE